MSDGVLNASQGLAPTAGVVHSGVPRGLSGSPAKWVAGCGSFLSVEQLATTAFLLGGAAR